MNNRREVEQVGVYNPERQPEPRLKGEVGVSDQCFRFKGISGHHSSARASMAISERLYEGRTPEGIDPEELVGIRMQ